MSYKHGVSYVATEVEQHRDGVTVKDQIHPRWVDRVALIDANSPQKSNSSNSIASGKGLTPDMILSLACNSGLQHIVQDSADQVTELNTAALMIAEPEKFLAYPLSSILSPTEAGAEREKELTGFVLEFKSLKERKAMREQIDAFLDSIACPASLTSDVHLIIDELVTNAVYNAPYQMRSDDTNPGIPRIQANATIPGNLTGRLFMGRLDKRLVIGCQDPFGSLEPTRLLRRLEKCHADGLGQSIHWGTGGAGIGSFLVFERSSSYFVGVRPSMSTIVCSQVSLLRSERARASIPKSLHWFDYEE